MSLRSLLRRIGSARWVQLWCLCICSAITANSHSGVLSALAMVCAAFFAWRLTDGT